MILSLRQRHRSVFLALAVAVPVAFALSLASRPSIPDLRPEVPGVAPQSPNRLELWTRQDLWKNLTIQTRLLTSPPSSVPSSEALAKEVLVGPVAVQILPRESILKPDMLLYWAKGEREIHETLPDDAILLGSIDPTTFAPLALPESAKTQPGRLVLYSLADHELVASSKPFIAK